MHFTKWENQSEKSAYYMTPTLWRSRKDHWLLCCGGGMNRQSKDDFRTAKILCMILSWWILVIIHLSKLTACTTPLWWRMLIMGEAMCLWGLGLYGKSLFFPLNFAVNLKLLQNMPIKIIIKFFETKKGKHS